MLLIFLLVGTALQITRGKVDCPTPTQAFCPVPVVEVRPFVTTSSPTLYFPKIADRCWDIHLLYTTSPKSNLRLRDGKDL
jgi:hypothetical protein